MRALPLFLMLIPAVAVAQILPDSLAESHFSRGFCYEMVLSQEELLAAPDRQLAALRLERQSMGAMVAPGNVAMDVIVRLRGEASLRDGREIEATARCRPEPEGLRCSVDGDGGAFFLRAEGIDLRWTVEEEGIVVEDWRGTQRLSGEATGPDREAILRPCS